MYNYFKEAIDAKQISVADVARNTGIPKSTFSDWKSGRCNPKTDKLLKIAEYLDVSLEFLTTGKDKPEFVMPEYDSSVHDIVEKYGVLPEDDKEIVHNLVNRLYALNDSVNSLEKENEELKEENDNLIDENEDLVNDNQKMQKDLSFYRAEDDLDGYEMWDVRPEKDI